ncbi:MAG: hypothetical protein E5Y12_25860, partial [Mesorhizobium sp.]
SHHRAPAASAAAQAAPRQMQDRARHEAAGLDPNLLQSAALPLRLWFFVLTQFPRESANALSPENRFTLSWNCSQPTVVSGACQPAGTSGMRTR